MEHECDLIKKILLFAREHDLESDISWDDDLNFYINCNDVFFWGCADGEPITEDTLPILKQAVEEIGVSNGHILYCARMRKLRPQGAYYKYINKQDWDVFNACGEEREVGMGNPYKPGEYKS
jgi:hypothetical protein